ncbi:MFS transporter, putative metabolite transport protein [Amycolatopsis xylanica]|uniref:MFS transporter, putative metabolite transport protein n=1 Tax=Amycolatopsis xylanica TaxID=589385 RepID=A0A1H3QV21_9PSEU|nr:MFS transporter [Amycolatopsis xylanica]SDZ17384.1 MFS transporter, putative metabolite transport protein [Amycolatopsis xylanica]
MTQRTLENSKPSKTHWLITMYAGGGEFCDGYILSIIGVALPLITGAFQLSGAMAGVIGSASLVGMFFGGLVFGYVTDRIGRQKVYLADIAAFIILSLLQFFATDPWQLTVLRFLMGIAIGADFAIAATIASEFAPQRSRGPLLVVLVTMWSVGAATAYVAGWAMLSLGDDAWKWMLASSAIPAALILMLRIGTPESPRWLLSKGRTEEAREVLTKMLGPGADFSDLEADTDSRTRYGDIFRGRYRKRTLFVCVFWACQLLPIYAITTYQPTILHSLGLAEGNASYLGAVIIQIFFVLGSLSGALVVNKGRRKLLLWSFAIAAVPLFLLAALVSPSAWLVILLFAVFGVASFSSQCLQAIYPSELFPTGVRATANGFATGVSRVGAAIGTYGAPLLLAQSTRLAMLVGGLIAVAGLVTSYFLAPETNGMTLAESSSAEDLAAIR